MESIAAVIPARLLMRSPVGIVIAVVATAPEPPSVVFTEIDVVRLMPLNFSEDSEVISVIRAVNSAP